MKKKTQDRHGDIAVHLLRWARILDRMAKDEHPNFGFAKAADNLRKRADQLNRNTEVIRR